MISQIVTLLTNGLTIATIDIVGLVLLPIILQGLLLASLSVYVTGAMLNYTLYQTIIQMANNLGSNGLGPTINAVWTTVRDVANMLFIFALLYTAIMTIFGKGDYKRTILNLIIAALLINFSLFFTKVIIDVANYLALVFYDAIVPGITSTGLGNLGSYFGISNIFIAKMGLPLLYDISHLKTLANGTLVTQAVLSILVLVIVAFIFFFVSILFVIRYVILILVMILSPLMFVSLILPKEAGASGYTKKWWDALIGQAFFAPAYFFMTWITLKVINGILTAQHLLDSQGNPLFSWNFAEASVVAASQGSQAINMGPNSTMIQTVFNFVIIIAFLIATLTITKSVANRSGGWMSSITKWAGGAAGGATVGLAGKYGRGTIGRYAQKKLDDPELQARAARGERSARLQLAAAEKGAKSSFDIRATGLGDSLGAGKAQKGGFAADLKEKQKHADDLAKKFAPTEDQKKAHQKLLDAAEERKKEAKKELESARQRAEKEARDTLDRSELIRSQKSEEEARKQVENSRLGGMKVSPEEQATLDKARTESSRLSNEYEDRVQAYVDEKTAAKQARKEAADTSHKELSDAGNEGQQKLNVIAQKRQEKIDKLQKQWWRPDMDKVNLFGKPKKEQENYVKAFRKAAKGKTKDEQIAELAQEKVKEASEAEKPPAEEGGEAGTGSGTPKP